MKVISGIGQLNKKYRRVIAAIGVFDSVHRGHQHVIRQAVDEARRIGGTSVVVTFDPHPVSVLQPARFSAYVLTLKHRLQLIKSLGADVCLVIRFDSHLARMTADDFVSRVLVGKLGVRKVVVGEDFHFGHDRKGAVEFLKEQGKRFRYDVRSVQTRNIAKVNIKTSYIKKLIKAGKLNLLKKFLGRPYSMLASVTHGEKIGRKLGFPTANLRKENVVILPSGIYCVNVFYGQRKMAGVFYIGTKPSIKRARRDVVLEAHILDYAGDLYGKSVLVEFLNKIRDDKRFSDDKELSRQIARDVKRARVFFRGRSSH
jgi:riboflavin kinase / FMN adenylyltransferase